MLTASEILTIWERGLERPLVQRSVLLLAAASPDLTADAIASLSIGARDARLLKFRADLFGQKLVNNAACPHCASRIEWEQNVADLLVDGSVKTHEEAHVLKEENYMLRFRLPNSLDMAAIERLEPNAALRHLLQRCVLTAERDGAACAIENLPDSIIEALNRRIEMLDPQAEIRINLNCPDCGLTWDVMFDIATYFWRELETWAEKLLQAVHKLAKAYGWSEPEILALSPVRRQLYLGMIGV